MMNPTVFAMRRPVTTVMLVVALISGGILAYNRMRVDIFPSLNTQAPLGLAAIGGLVMSTFATLLVLPSVFAVVIGRSVFRSPSIYPDDRESVHYDPMVFADEVDEGDHGEPTAHDVVSRHTVDELLGFLRSILHEIQSKRRDMVTHHTVDDLLGTLGFAKERTADEDSQAPHGGQASASEPGPSPNTPPSRGDS